MTLPNEAEHIALARQGDKNAFRVLVEAYQDRLFGLVLSFVRQREQAEDLIQEIFVKAYFALESFEGQSAFYTWLYRIATNHSMDYLRKHRPDQVSLDKPIDDAGEITVANTIEGPSSDHPDAQLDVPTAAKSLLDGLDPDQRVILTLRELEGYSYEELAEILDCPVNTVKSRLNRAREALKTAYVEKYGPIASNTEAEETISEEANRNISDRHIVKKSGETS